MHAAGGRSSPADLAERMKMRREASRAALAAREAPPPPLDAAAATAATIAGLRRAEAAVFEGQPAVAPATRLRSFKDERREHAERRGAGLAEEVDVVVRRILADLADDDTRAAAEDGGLEERLARGAVRPPSPASASALTRELDAIDRLVEERLPAGHATGRLHWLGDEASGAEGGPGAMPGEVLIDTLVDDQPLGRDSGPEPSASREHREAASEGEEEVVVPELEDEPEDHIDGGAAETVEAKRNEPREAKGGGSGGGRGAAGGGGRIGGRGAEERDEEDDEEDDDEEEFLAALRGPSTDSLRALLDRHRTDAPASTATADSSDRADGEGAEDSEPEISRPFTLERLPEALEATASEDATSSMPRSRAHRLLDAPTEVLDASAAAARDAVIRRYLDGLLARAGTPSAPVGASVQAGTSADESMTSAVVVVSAGATEGTTETLIPARTTASTTTTAVDDTSATVIAGAGDEEW